MRSCCMKLLLKLLLICSAGVGRSGTFIAIDIEMQRIKHENIVDVYNCVCKLRFCRDLMVQSEVRHRAIKCTYSELPTLLIGTV